MSKRKRRFIRLLGSFARYEGTPPVPEVLMVLSAVRRQERRR